MAEFRGDAALDVGLLHPMEHPWRDCRRRSDEADENTDVDPTERLTEVRLLWPGADVGQTALFVAFLLTLPFNTGRNQ